MKYQSIRHKMKDGDLLLWRGKSVIARLIQLFNQHYNHASLVIEAERHHTRRVLLYEALSRGVEPEFLSARIDRYNGECWWFPLRKEYEAYRPALYQAGNSYAGTPYDYKTLFKNIFGLMPIDVEALICSEYCFVVGRDARLPCKGITKTPRPDGLLKLKWWEDEGVQIGKRRGK